jgi:hypothetical protein
MNTELIARVEVRMATGEPFELQDLHGGDCHGPIYRVADRTIQKWRKAGYIDFTRHGRHVVWQLTISGQRHAEDVRARVASGKEA